MGHAAALPRHAHAAAGRPHQSDAVWCLLNHCEGRVPRKAVLTQGAQLPKLREAHRHAAPAGTQQDQECSSSAHMPGQLTQHGVAPAVLQAGRNLPACWAPVALASRPLHLLPRT